MGRALDLLRRKGEYAFSFEFLDNTHLANDGKACSRLHCEIRLAGDLSFSEQIFVGNDIYESVYRYNVLVRALIFSRLFGEAMHFSCWFYYWFLFSLFVAYGLGDSQPGILRVQDLRGSS